jgi:simple sugar transport system ATP-binding protein
MAVADSMTILRDGEFVARKDVKDTTWQYIAELMIGRKSKNWSKKICWGTRILSDEKIALEFRDYYVDMLESSVFGDGCNNPGR